MLAVGLPNEAMGLVTNAHCSKSRFETDTTKYKQPRNSIAGRNKIGRELFDPEPFTGGLCRLHSSVIRCEYHYLDSGETIDRGKIARIGTWGSRRISTVDGDYEVRDGYCLLFGETALKVCQPWAKLQVN